MDEPKLLQMPVLIVGKESPRMSEARLVMSQNIARFGDQRSSEADACDVTDQTTSMAHFGGERGEPKKLRGSICDRPEFKDDGQTYCCDSDPSSLSR